jgi:hypothetical protein
LIPVFEFGVNMTDFEDVPTDSLENPELGSEIEAAVASDPAPSDEEEIFQPSPEYLAILEEAKHEDFSDLDACNVLTNTGG